MPPFGAGNFAGAPELTGLPDGVLVPDPTTFRLLPWVEKTGWILSDAHFQNGREHPFSTRGVLRRQLADLATLGYDYVGRPRDRVLRLPAARSEPARRSSAAIRPSRRP